MLILQARKTCVMGVDMKPVAIQETELDGKEMRSLLRKLSKQEGRAQHVISLGFVFG